MLSLLFEQLQKSSYNRCHRQQSYTSIFPARPEIIDSKMTLRHSNFYRIRAHNLYAVFFLGADFHADSQRFGLMLRLPMTN